MGLNATFEDILKDRKRSYEERIRMMFDLYRSDREHFHHLYRHCEIRIENATFDRLALNGRKLAPVAARSTLADVMESIASYVLQGTGWRWNVVECIGKEEPEIFVGPYNREEGRP